MRQSTARAREHSHGHTHDHSHDHVHGAQGGHSHGHHHHHAPASFDRAFLIGIALNVLIVLAEVVYGLRANSLSLVADAGHNLGDVLGLVLAWVGTVLARRAPTRRRTYGMRRFSILAALGNAGLLLAAVGAILLESVQRLFHPEPVATGPVLVVAVIGIIVNLGTALGFRRGTHDLNLRGAVIHMLGDAAVSAGVVIAALVIGATGWFWVDPAVGVLLALLIAWSSWGLLRESLDLALDAVPASIDPEAVSAYLGALPGVREVHDLHIWGMSTTHIALTAHLIRPGAADDDAFLTDACRELQQRFGIGHATIQVERGSGADQCGLAAEDVV